MSPGRAAQFPRDRVRPAMAAGLAFSLLAHACALWAFGRVQAHAAQSDPRRLNPIESEQTPPDEDAPLRLGMDIPENASIAWLGVLENPVEAEAPESEVDQAALTPEVGAQPSPPVDPRPPTEPPIEQPIEPPVDRPTEPSEQSPAEDPAEPPVEPTTQPAAETPPGPALEALPPPFPVETPEGEGDVSPASDPAEPAAPTAPAEPQIMGPPAPPETRPESQAPSPPVPATEPRPATEPAERGTPGVEDQRAADAAKRRNARELRADLLGQPLQASGDLNFKTVRPTWSLQVRNAYNPQRNPVIEIHFGPDGRVKLAEFVPQPDGTRGSGYAEVDQPLLNAVYRWTASGKAIDALDKDDEDARVSVVIRFLISTPPRGD